MKEPQLYEGINRYGQKIIGQLHKGVNQDGVGLYYICNEKNRYDSYDRNQVNPKTIRKVNQ